MYIVSKENSIILNLENVVEVFTKKGGENLIFAKQPNDKVIILQGYNTEKEAKEAILMIAEEISIGRKDIIYVPTPEEIKGRLVNSGAEKQYHISGKKTKGHGGS